MPTTAWYRTPLGAAAHGVELAAIEQLAAPRAGERALNAGCGSGIYSGWLAERGLAVTGVDHDPRMLAAARRRVPTASFVGGDLWMARGFSGWEYAVLVIPPLLALGMLAIAGYAVYREPHLGHTAAPGASPQHPSARLAVPRHRHS